MEGCLTLVDLAGSEHRIVPWWKVSQNLRWKCTIFCNFALNLMDPIPHFSLVADATKLQPSTESDVLRTMRNTMLRGGSWKWHTPPFAEWCDVSDLIELVFQTNNLFFSLNVRLTKLEHHCMWTLRILIVPALLCHRKEGAKINASLAALKECIRVF